MLIFSWTLTPNQIGILKGIRDHMDAGEPDGGDAIPGQVRNWLPGCRLLLREGLIVHEAVPNDKPHIHVGKSRPRWNITDKGRVMLQLVEMEIRDQSAALMRLGRRSPLKLNGKRAR